MRGKRWIEEFRREYRIDLGGGTGPSMHHGWEVTIHISHAYLKRFMKKKNYLQIIIKYSQFHIAHTLNESYQMLRVISSP